jgi:hypothetical protein
MCWRTDRLPASDAIVVAKTNKPERAARWAGRMKIEKIFHILHRRDIFSFSFARRSRDFIAFSVRSKVRREGGQLGNFPPCSAASWITKRYRFGTDAAEKLIRLTLFWCRKF